MTVKVESLNSVLESFEKELRVAFPSIKISVRVKGIYSSYGEGTASVAIYNATHIEQSQIQIKAYNLFNSDKYKGKELGTFTNRNQVYDRSSQTWSNKVDGPYVFTFSRIEFSIRQRQSKVKVTTENCRDVLKKFENPGQGSIIFGQEDGCYGITDKILDVAILTDDGLQIFALPTRGFLVDLSRSLGEGKSSQDVLFSYPSIRFNGP